MTVTEDAQPRKRPARAPKPQGQWKVDGKLTLNHNEAFKLEDDALNVRQRILGWKPDAFIGIELPDESANPDSMLPRPHSVLTEDLRDEPGQPTREAYDRVIDFFTAKLGLQPTI